MKIIVDTCVWSLAFRRKSGNKQAKENLISLINEYRIILLGPIRQEVLSGIPNKKQFNVLKETLSNFPDYNIQSTDYEAAADMFNICRSHGIQGSFVDFTICSVAIKNKFLIYSTDKDFINYKKHLPVELYAPF